MDINESGATQPLEGPEYSEPSTQPSGTVQPAAGILPADSQPLAAQATSVAIPAGLAPPVEAAAIPAEAVAPAPPVRRRHFRPKVGPVRIPTKVHTFDSFRHRDYRFMWTTTFLSSGGFWLQQVVIGWLAYQLTQSAFLTTLIMGLDALPLLLAGPVGGVLVDSWDRR